MADNTSDFESMYNKLYKDVQNANADKKRQLENVFGEVGKLLQIICEPDPPGCNGPDPQVTLEQLAQECRDWNTKKEKLLTTISDDIGNLLRNVCEPDPPGC
jgi:hypothetical protein